MPLSAPSLFLLHTRWRSLPALAAALLIAACSTPLPKPPPSAAQWPVQYLHQEGWLATAASTTAQTTTADTEATQAHDAWWQVYADPTLNALLTQVTAQNASLAQAAAQWRAAQAAVAAAQAARLPQVDANASINRAGQSGRDNTDNPTQTRYASGLNISWAPDLWGRIALRQLAAQAQADGAQADLAAAQLSLQLAAAENYIALRQQSLDGQLLQQTLQAYERSLQLTQNQYEAGFVARADVIQAQIQLESIHSQIQANQRQQALTHNALALLSGQTPAQFQLPAPAAQQTAELPDPPTTPAQTLTALLLQRPDIAAAANRLAAANANLGLAQTAWLPEVNLSASAGLQASAWRQFIESPLRVWSLGPALAATLFDGGTRRAATAQAEAEHEALTAAWRSTVLQAVQEVENALTSAHWLQAQGLRQQTLQQLAHDNLRVVQNQYEAGMVSYLEVSTAQNLALTSQRNALDIQAQRLQASMQLVAALGGGWQAPETLTSAVATASSAAPTP